MNERRYEADKKGWEEKGPSTALVVYPEIRVPDQKLRDPEGRLEEAVGLARAISLKVVHAEALKLSKPVPATLIGGGVVARFHDLVKEKGIDIVIVDAALSPVQQRNLERALEAKVIDRTGLILEIFGARARTHEGRLQVELAALTFQRSRLVRSWTHLERQRGGLGFIGGPGESQLEIDRRLIDERIQKLKRELEQVKRTRGLHREARARVPYPIISLVGYTNAGKSTLFNRMTRADVMAKDMLFATLDPTMRRLRLPSGQEVILSDTVGFITDLPTSLIAAFRATLEEVRAADVIIHVRDIASTDSMFEKQDVESILDTLDLDPEVPRLEAHNKVDLLAPDERARIVRDAASDPGAFALSAIEGEGVEELLKGIEAALSRRRTSCALDIDLSDGEALSWLYRNGHVIDRRDDERFAHMTVSLDQDTLSRFERHYGQYVQHAAE